MQATVSRFTPRVVSLAKQATGDRSEPAVRRPKGGFADWVLVTIHTFREFTSSSYRARLDDLSQSDDVGRKLDLESVSLPMLPLSVLDTRASKWRSGGRASAILGISRHSAPFMWSTQPGLIDREQAGSTRIQRIIGSRRANRLRSLTVTTVQY